MSKPEYAFFGGKIVPIGEAKVSVMTNSFNYGTGVFAGMRAYWNGEQQQLYIFRATDHFERFRQSASLLRINVKQTEAELTDILSNLLRAEDYHEHVYIRPVAYKSTEGLGPRLDVMTDDVTIFATPSHGGYSEDDPGIHPAFRRGVASRTTPSPRAARSSARMLTPRSSRPTRCWQATTMPSCSPRAGMCRRQAPPTSS
jgi:branched-chain amino acid aminotransferase